MNLATGKFYAASQKQKITTLSSTEGETYAATEAAKDIIFFRNVLAELGFPQFHPTPLYIDNKSTITLGSNFALWQPQPNAFATTWHASTSCSN